jgi:hypothetical protein
MNIEVRDNADAIISTGVMTEMGPLFSPSIPAEIHNAFEQYIAENSHKESGRWDGDADGKHYRLRFAN